MFRKIESFVGIILMLVGSILVFCGCLNHGLGVALFGLALYLPDEEICADTVYKLFKRKAAERSSDEK